MAWGDQFYNQQTGQYEVVGQNGVTENPYEAAQNAATYRDPIEQAKYWKEWKETAARRGDPNAQYEGSSWVPGTKRMESTGEGGDRSMYETPGYWQDNTKIDPHATIPKALWHLLDDPRFNQKGKWGTKGEKYLAGIQYSKEDPRKSGVKLRDPNAVGYDPEYGYFMHQDNIYQKKHWQDKVGKYMPAAIMALGTMGMSLPASLTMNAGVAALRGLSEGQKIGDIAKNVGINAALGAASSYGGQYISGATGSNLAGKIASKAIGYGAGLAKEKLMYPGNRQAPQQRQPVSTGGPQSTFVRPEIAMLAKLRQQGQQQVSYPRGR